jgi:tetratricopeptide (TPR) repeat protein
VRVPGPLRGEAWFWTAEAQAEAGKLDAAEAAYREVLKSRDEATRRAEAELGLGWVLLKTGRGAEADALLGPLETNTPPALAEPVRLMRARWLVEQGRGPEAVPLLDALTGSGSARVAAEARFWRGEVLLAQGRSEDALAEFLSATSTNTVPEAVRWRAWLQQGEAARQLKRWDDAEAALARVVRGADDDALRLEAVRRMIAVGREQGRGAETLERLRRQFTRDGAGAGGAASLVAVGEALAEDGKDREAVETWKAVVAMEPKGTALRLRALGLAADRLIAMGRAAEGWELHAQAVREAEDRALAVEAGMRRGEALAFAGREGDALAQFELVAANPASGALREKAMFNALVCLGRLGRRAEFEALAARFAAAHPQSVLRARVLDEQAALLARAGEGAKARAAWMALVKEFPDAEIRPRVELAIVESLLREGDAKAAGEAADALAARGMGDPVGRRAAFLQLLAGQMAGTLGSESVPARLAELLEKSRADADLAPDVLFELGEVAFQQEDFAGAQGHFVRLVAEYPRSRWVETARYFAGVAALRRGDAGAAVELFELLLKQHPRTEWATEARLREAAALRLLGKFPDALAMYEAVLRGSTNGARAEASLGLADCEYRLALEDPDRYERALELYGRVAVQTGGTPDVVNEAGWKRAQTLEKLGRPEEALTAYMDVIYGRVLRGGPGTVRAEYYWLGKAASDAGRILEARGDWSGALAVYRMAEKVGGPEAATWRDRRLKVQREHFLYD